MAWGEGLPLIDGYRVGDPITGVHHDASGVARGIRDSTTWMATYMAGVLKVSNMIWVIFSRLALRVKGGLSQQHGVLLRGHTQLVVEGVVPDLHVIPVGDDAVLNGVLEGQDASLALGFIIHIGVLLAHAHHHALVPGAPHNGGEDSLGSIVTHEADFAHAGACCRPQAWQYHHPGEQLLCPPVVKMEQRRREACAGRADADSHGHTVEITKRFKGLDPIDKVPEELWTEVPNIVQEEAIKTLPKKKKCKKAQWLSEEAICKIAEKTEAKHKREKERYTHLNAEFRRIAKRHKKAFLSEQCKNRRKQQTGKDCSSFQEN